MTEKRRGGRRKSDEESQKLTKEEDAIAQFVRFNCPTKMTMFEGNEVYYFLGSKAVDTLYDSKKYGHNAKTVKFANRAAAVTFLRTMQEKGLFFRARKLVAKKKAGSGEEEEEKKKRKVKLELHQDQSFNDANDVYVWIYDPTPLKKKIIGALMILGTIAGCLFSLWPIWLRQLVYYLSLAGIGFFGLLFAVAIARTILYYVIWAATMGRHNLWILPNLSENCGFFESFQPWYTYEYLPSGKIEKKKKDESKKKKGNAKNSDAGKKDREDTKQYSASGDEDYQRSEEEGKSEAKKSDGSAGSEEGSASDPNDEGHSQSSASSAEGDSENVSGQNKGVRHRRRARKEDDDDFVLVEKQ